MVPKEDFPHFPNMSPLPPAAEEPQRSPGSLLLKALDETLGRPRDRGSFLDVAGTHLVVFVHGFRGNRADFRWA